MHSFFLILRNLATHVDFLYPSRKTQIFPTHLYPSMKNSDSCDSIERWLSQNISFFCAFLCPLSSPFLFLLFPRVSVYFCSFISYFHWFLCLDLQPIHRFSGLLLRLICDFLISSFPQFLKSTSRQSRQG